MGISRVRGTEKNMNDFVASPVPEDLPTEDFRWLMAFWNDLRGSRDMPARSDFTPAQLVPYLPRIVLTDVEHEPLRFRARLVGTGIVADSGTDPTGRYYEDLPGSEDVVRRHAWVVANRKPYFAHDIPLVWASNKFNTYSVLVMPLSADGDSIDMMLSYLRFD